MFRTKKDVDRHVSDVLSKIDNENEKNLRGFTFARLFYQVKDYESSKKYLSGFMSVRDHHAPSHKLMAQIYEATNNPESALQSYKRSLEIDPHQNDIVLKICELYCQLPVDHETARYWADRAEQLFPHNDIVFKLRECLVSAEGEPDRQELENLIATELAAQPKNIDLRIKLLRLYLDTERVKEAYDHATMIESRRLFPCSTDWYYLLGDIFEAYQEEFGHELDSQFYIHYLTALDHLIFLTLAEPHTFVLDCEKKSSSINDAAAALLTFDQLLKKASEKDIREGSWTYFVHHMKGQLYYHMASLLMKRAKKDQGNRKEAFKFSAALALVCYTFKPMNLLQEIWFSQMEDNQKTFTNFFQQGALRTSFIGHILMNMCKEDKGSWLQKIKQDICVSQVKERIYSRIYSSVVQKEKILSSYFILDSTFEKCSLEFPSEAALKEYDKSAYKLRPDALHHLVWLELHRRSSNIGTYDDNLIEIFKNLLYSNKNLSKGSCESLCLLDLEAYIHATLYQAQFMIERRNNVLGVRKNESQISYPPDIADPLCSKQQAMWWKAAYGLYSCSIKEKLGEHRYNLQHGLEVIRGIGNHGLEVQLVIHLARMFAEKASYIMKSGEDTKNKSKINPENVEALHLRSTHYWNIALGMLEKLASGQTPRIPKDQMFVGCNKSLSKNEINAFQEEGQLYLAVRYMDSDKLNEAAEILSKLSSPYGSYYLALTLKKLASQEQKFSNTKTAFLNKAKNALHETMDRIKDDKSHPLNKEIYLELEDVESELANDLSIGNLNNNEDVDETDTYDESPVQNSSFYVTPDSGKFATYSTPRPCAKFTTPRSKFQMSNMDLPRHFEPSPERLDAQIRALALNQDTLVKTIHQQQQTSLEINKEMVEALKQNKEVVEQLKKLLEELNLGGFKSHGKSGNKKHGYMKGQGDEEEDYNDYDPNGLLEFYAEEGAEEYRTSGYGYDHSSRMVHDAAAAAAAAAAAPLNYVVSPALPPGPPPALNHYNYQYPPHAVLPAPPPAVAERPPFYHPPPGQGLPFSEGQQLPQFHFHVASPVVKPSPPIMSSVASMPQAVSAVTMPPPPPVRLPPPQSVMQPPAPLRVPTAWPKAVGVPHAFQIPLPSSAPFVSAAEIIQQTSSHTASASSSSVTTTQSELKNLLQTPPASGTIAFGQPLHMIATTSPSILNNSPSIFSGLSKTPEAAKLERYRCDSDNAGSPDIDGHDIEKEVMGDFKPLIPLPAEIVVETGEENEEVLFEDRAKLYRFVDQEWKERGIGTVKILHDEGSGRCRLLMRRDQVLKVCANHYITSNMAIHALKNSDKAWTWVAQDFADEELKPEHFCIRFKTAEIAASFKDAFQKALNMVKNSEIKRMSSPSATTASATTISTSTPTTATSITTSSPVAQKGFGTKFLPKAGSWTCPTCYVSNAADKLLCIACETKKPGTQPPGTSSNVSSTLTSISPVIDSKSIFLQPSVLGGSQFTFGPSTIPNTVVSSTTSNAFGSATASSMFVSVTTSSTFGSTAISSAFGSMTPSSIFASVAPSGTFGSVGTSSIFGSSSSNTFGSTIPSTTGPATTTSSIFASTTAMSTVGSVTTSSSFGSTTTSSMLGSTTTSIFGSAVTPSIFGSTVTSTVFGSTTTPCTFGSATTSCISGSTTTPSNTFGSTATSSSFGSTTASSNLLTPKSTTATSFITPKNIFGGFTFSSSPMIRETESPEIKDQEILVISTKSKNGPQVTKVNASKPSPFSGFSFKAPTTLTTSSITTDNLNSVSTNENISKIQTMVKNISQDSVTGANVNPASEIANDSLVTKGLEPPSVSSSESSLFVHVTADGRRVSTDGTDGAPEEFVPTAEFKPVVPLPALVDVKTGEEGEEKLFGERAKLFRYDSEVKEWKERGIGELKILYWKDSKKYRIVMRREQVLKICANHNILPDMKLTPLASSDRSWAWYAQDFSDGELKQEQFAVKFKSADIAQQFFNVFQKCQSELKALSDKNEQTTDKCTENKTAFDQLFKPVPESWICPNCYKSNMNRSSCVYCQTSKSNIPVPTSTVSTVEQKPISELFKVDANSWECQNCLVRNKSTDNKCVSCEASKLSSVSSVSQKDEVSDNVSVQNKTQTFADLFKPQPGSWECQSCYVPNSADKSKCASCENVKPGTATSVFPPVSNFGSFQFGSLASRTSSDTQLSSNFTFGAPKTTSSEFVFGLRPATLPTTFSFGLSAVSSKESETIGFKPTLTASTAPAVFGGMTQKSLSSDKTSTSTTQMTTTPTNVFEPSSVFSFGNPQCTTVSDAGSVEFRFGSPQKYEFNFSGVRPRSPTKTPKSPRSPATPSDADDEEENESFDADSIYFQPVIPLPPKVEVKTGEEDEKVLFCKRAKLFRFSSAEWKERGIGDIKILFEETQKKARLLMRRDQVLKVCLNHYITKDMSFEWRGDKSLTWAATDFSESEPSPELLAVRFKTKELAEQFKVAIDDAMKLMTEKAPSSDIAAAAAAFSFKADGLAKVSCFNSTPGAQSIFSGQGFKFGGFGSQGKEGKEVKKEKAEIDEIEIIYQALPSPDKIEEAKKLMLPPSFYLYENKPPCPGCKGCDNVIPAYKGSESKETESSESEDDPKKSSPVKTSSTISEQLLFSSALQDALSFADLATNSGFEGLAKSSSKKNAFAGAGTPLFANLNTSTENDADDETVPENPDIHFEPVIPLPDLVAVRTGEEDETPVFVNRAKLFRFDAVTKQWKERGVGDLKILKHNEKLRYRIILRREQVHKIACNHCITEDLELAPMATSELALCWNAIDYAEGIPEASQFAVRFKNKDLLEQFRQKFNDCKEALKQGNYTASDSNVSQGASGDNKLELEEQKVSEVVPEATSDSQSNHQTTESETNEDANSDDDSDEDDIMFEKRVSFEIFDENAKQFVSVGMGRLQIMYDDTVYGYRIVMINDQGVYLCDHVIAIQTCLRVDKKKATWCAIDLSVDPPKRRQFRATFSSVEALNEFSKCFEEGKEAAVNSEIVEKSSDFLTLPSGAQT